MAIYDLPQVKNNTRIRAMIKRLIRKQYISLSTSEIGARLWL